MIVVNTTVTAQTDSSASSDASSPSKKHGYSTGILLVILGICIGGCAYWVLPRFKKTSSSQNVSAQKFCSGVNIVFFPGGTPTDSFASVVYKGAKDAETVLGPRVQYVWSDWDSNKMVTQFKSAIDTAPDAIAMMGHPGAAALGSFVDEAERKNIIVTLQNVDIPAVREQYTSKGFGYVGQDLYNSGVLVSSGIVRKYQPKAGTEAIVFGVDSATDPARYERTKGAIDGLKSGKLVVHEITISAAVQQNTNSPAAQKMVADAFSQYPNAKIIVIDHGALTASMPTILKNLGKKPGDYVIGGFDLSANTVAGIQSGYIGLIQDQQPYLQGFLPILQACLTKKYRFAGLTIDTGVGLIDNSNVDVVANLAKQGIR